MEQWTLGAIAVGLAFLITLVGSIKKVINEVTDSIGNVVKKEMKPLENKIDALSRKVDEVDLDSTKNFLVSKIGEIERGEHIDEITRQRVYEEYEHYINAGGNSYIHTRFDELKKKGLV